MIRKNIIPKIALSMAMALAIPAVPVSAEELEDSLYDIQEIIQDETQNEISLEQQDVESTSTDHKYGDVVFFEVEGEPVDTGDGVSLEDAVSVEVGSRNYDIYKNDYVYSKLSADEKAFFKGLETVAKKYMTTNVDATMELSGRVFMDGVSYGNLSLDRAKELTQIFAYQNSQYYFIANYWAWGGGKVYLGIYDDFANGVDRANATEKFFQKVERVVAVVSTKTTDYDRAKAAHDEICKLVTYDHDFSLSDSGYNQTAWSTFMMGETVCAGYAKAFEIVANACGIETCGDTSPQGTYAHAWNRSYVDGNWYYVDCTWDDDYYGIGTVFYDYFVSALF